jgi:hypothetical protein
MSNEAHPERPTEVRNESFANPDPTPSYRALCAQAEAIAAARRAQNRQDRKAYFRASANVRQHTDQRRREVRATLAGAGLRPSAVLAQATGRVKGRVPVAVKVTVKCHDLDRAAAALRGLPGLLGVQFGSSPARIIVSLT